MQQLINNQDTYTVPEVADDYLAEHATEVVNSGEERN